MNIARLKKLFLDTITIRQDHKYQQQDPVAQVDESLLLEALLE